MFLLKEPSRAHIDALLAAQSTAPFSYSEPGATRAQPPPGFTVDHYRTELGRGAEAFERAVEAVRQWKMFDTGWLRLCWPDAPIVTGSTVAPVVQHYGFWSLNACRIIYVIDDRGPRRRYGFAYGTLPEHGETGEERFTVELQPRHETVWYDIFAFSRPKGLARLGYPLARRLQKRFARDSQAAMRRAVSTGH